jgi:hypothetical protein
MSKGGSNAIGSTNDPAVDGTDPFAEDATVISLLKQIVINTTPVP